MLKKIVTTLKKFFSTQEKSLPASQTHISEEPKKVSKPRPPRNQDKTTVPQRARQPRKRETREEYKRRHEQMDREAAKEIEKTSQAPVSNEPWDPSEFKVQPSEGKARFHDFNLAPQIMHALHDMGFQYCTPVQAETLGKALNGEDVTAQAQTGTGKTAAFLLTIFNFLIAKPIEGKRKHGTPRVLILAPTRELVLQIEKDAHAIGKYTSAKILSILGGIGYEKQATNLKNELCDILICTPGRLLDFMEKELVDLSKVQILVIDEADRMLDMGFIPSVTKIVRKTTSRTKRQTMFFTATMSYDVQRLADSWTKDVVSISVSPEEVTVHNIRQITYITTWDEKQTLLFNLLQREEMTRVLIFVNRRDEAQKLKDVLDGFDVPNTLLSGDVDQVKRIRRLDYFREGKVRVLIATDVASRGIHVEAISHVINYNLPYDPEDYVHRIGRTGRAGADGVSISFADQDSVHELPKIEEYLGKKFEYVYPEDELLAPIPEQFRHKPAKKAPRKNNASRKPYPPRRKSPPRRNESKE